MPHAHGTGNYAIGHEILETGVIRHYALVYDALYMTPGS